MMNGIAAFGSRHVGCLATRSVQLSKKSELKFRKTLHLGLSVLTQLPPQLFTSMNAYGVTLSVWPVLSGMLKRGAPPPTPPVDRNEMWTARRRFELKFFEF